MSLFRDEEQTRLQNAFQSVRYQSPKRDSSCSALSAAAHDPDGSAHAMRVGMKPIADGHGLLFYRRKKTCFFKQVYKMVGERGLRLSSISALRAVAAQRCLATLGANLLRRFSSSFLQTKKNLLFQAGL